MRIAIDLCGVVAQFNLSFAQLLQRIQRVDVDIFASDFPKVWSWPEHYGWSTDTINRAWAEVKASGFFWKMLFPYPSAHEDLKFLESLKPKHEIYFITSRLGGTAKPETEEWLAARGITNPTVIISSKKGLVCKGLEADVIIDDSPDNLLDVFGASINTKCVLFNRPYNVGYRNYFWGTCDSIREGLKNVV